MPINKKYLARMEPSCYYHIVNRTNNKEELFPDDEDRQFFLEKFQEMLSDFLEVYAFCLLGNHFHFLIKTKSILEIEHNISLKESKELGIRGMDFLRSSNKEELFHGLVEIQFRKFFIAYAMNINRLYKRNGNLFSRRFKRVAVIDSRQLMDVCYYIHLNPVKHAIIKDFRNYPWSSYQSIVSSKSKVLNLNIVGILGIFGGVQEFEKFHMDKWEEM